MTYTTPDTTAFVDALKIAEPFHSHTHHAVVLVDAGAGTVYEMQGVPSYDEAVNAREAFITLARLTCGVSHGWAFVLRPSTPPMTTAAGQSICMIEYHVVAFPQVSLADVGVFEHSDTPIENAYVECTRRLTGQPSRYVIDEERIDALRAWRDDDPHHLAYDFWHMPVGGGAFQLDNPGFVKDLDQIREAQP